MPIVLSHVMTVKMEFALNWKTVAFVALGSPVSPVTKSARTIHMAPTVPLHVSVNMAASVTTSTVTAHVHRVYKANIVRMAAIPEPGEIIARNAAR